MGKKFDKLERQIEREYLRKGFPLAKAKEIGKGTAAKVYRAKLAKSSTNIPHHVQHGHKHLPKILKPWELI